MGAEGGKGMKNNTLYCNTCEHKDICGTYCVKDYKPPCDSKSSFRGNQGQTIQIADLTRIADALEKIARELEKANKLKALSFRKDSYVELDDVDEIMED